LTGTVIAVGGSNGKTGTKHLIDSALRGRKRGTISPKSFNNDIGVPLAIFPADPAQDYLVLELGTNHHGEIRTLTQIALPDVAVITNVAAEHLEGLGDLDGVRREEASIIEELKADGLLVVNGDDEALLDAVAPYRGRRVTFGMSEENDLFPTDVRCSLEGVRFRLNGNGRREFFLPLLGEHIAVNAVAAVAVARELGLKNDEIADALASATGPEMRLQLQRTAAGVTLLNDAYNANPASVKAALETLCTLPTEARRRVAVLGDMRELGDSTDRLHREIGQFVGTKAPELELLICVGEKAALIADEARDAGLDQSRVVRYRGTSEASEHIGRHVRDGDLVLLKGSRYMKLERIAECLAKSA
jgi:UDP-N-acetylmuramoyl-tripeptide--D-alanyl-D-alanine ligase